MSKKRVFNKEGLHAAAIGLNNASSYEPVKNGEESRIEAVEKIQGLSASIVAIDEFEPHTVFQVETIIELLNVREAPSVTSNILFVSTRGSVFLTESMDGLWIAVRPSTLSATWEKGFVMSKFVKEVDHGQHS